MTARGKGKGTSSLGACHGSPETPNLARSSLLFLVQAPASSQQQKTTRRRRQKDPQQNKHGCRCKVDMCLCQLKEGQSVRMQCEGKGGWTWVTEDVGQKESSFNERRQYKEGCGSEGT